MNVKQIAKIIREQAVELQHGSNTQKELGEQLVTIAVNLEHDYEITHFGIASASELSTGEPSPFVTEPRDPFK